MYIYDYQSRHTCTLLSYSPPSLPPFPPSLPPSPPSPPPSLPPFLPQISTRRCWHFSISSLLSPFPPPCGKCCSSCTTHSHGMDLISSQVCVCAFVRACVCACVRALRACVCACTCAHMCMRLSEYMHVCECIHTCTTCTCTCTCK